MLRIWTPQQAVAKFVKQVAPAIDDLTGRRSQTGPQVGEYPTGAWAPGEKPRLPRGRPGERRGSGAGGCCVAARVSLVAKLAGRVSMGGFLNQGLISGDLDRDEAGAVHGGINPGVAHYTGAGRTGSGGSRRGSRPSKRGDEEAATRPARPGGSRALDVRTPACQSRTRREAARQGGDGRDRRVRDRHGPAEEERP